MFGFIDISNWKSDLDADAVFPNVGGVVMKATGGTSFVDKTCDRFVQKARTLGKPWGFYHYAHDSGSKASAAEEAKFFYTNCRNYFGKGIPILDWEENTCSVEWVNTFVELIHKWTGVWCWIYANPWRFNQGGVNADCDRWVASYPSVAHPTYEDAAKWDCPTCDGSICAWQYCSDGYVKGYNGVVDSNVFYGNEKAWKSYALGRPYNEDEVKTDASNPNTAVIDGISYDVTYTRKG